MSNGALLLRVVNENHGEKQNIFQKWPLKVEAVYQKEQFYCIFLEAKEA